MHKGILLAASVLLACASAAASAAPKGVVLNFSAGEQLRLVGVSSVDRAPEPRSIAGPQWTIHAIDTAGRERWSRPIAAPRMFHGGADSDVVFAVAVPMIEDGDRIVVTGDEGRELWSHHADATLLATAEATGKIVTDELKHAFAATAKLQLTKPRQAWRDRSSVNSTKLAMMREDSAYSVDSREDDQRIAQADLSPEKNKSTTAGTPLFRVGGRVVTNNAQVRVFDANTNRLVVSSATNWRNSRYEFELAKGNYVFEVDDNRNRGYSPYFYRTPYRTSAIRIAGDLEVPEIPQHTARGTFSFVARFPCALITQIPYYGGNIAHTLHSEVTAEDGTRLMRSDDFSRVTFAMTGVADTTGYCPARYEFGFSPGVYSVGLTIPGWETLQFDDIRIADGESTRREHTFTLATRTLIWHASVTDASGVEIEDFDIAGSNDLNEPARLYYFWSSDRRSVEIPFVRGWTGRLGSASITDSEYSVSPRYFMDGRPLPSRVVLDTAATDNTLESGMLRIHGNGDRSKRFNILFLAEGYTDLNESYTDVDGDRQWDGVVWYDMNGDGQYKGSDDRSTIYGDDAYHNFPEPDPSSGNEPFVDQNGDGVLNINEAADFELNARDFMRSLLGSDFWEDHRDAFNAYLLFEPSNQAGFDVRTENGQVVVHRDTRYGATLQQPRLVMGLDRQAAMTRALSVLPEIDMVIVLVNQPLVTLARGNVTVAQPGLMVWPSGGHSRRLGELGPSHEMGHYMASLCDEYSEFEGVNPSHGQPTNWCPNVSYVSDPAKVPWADWLSNSDPEPSRSMDGSIGIFEGADYYSGGAYRPSYNSTMRDLSPLFNAPSRAALETAIHARTGPVRHEMDSTGRCSRVGTNAVRQRAAVCVNPMPDR